MEEEVKAAVASEAATKAAAKKFNMVDDDDGPATYGVIHESDHEVERASEEKQKIAVVADLAVKDPRGPAVAIIIRPSNSLMYSAIVNCITLLVILFYLLIPIMFPNLPDEEEKKKKEQEQAKFTQEQKDQAKRKEILESSSEGLTNASFVFLVIGLYGAGIAYSATIVVGAIKMQTLESYRWGMIATIMSFIPFAVTVPPLLRWAVTESPPDEFMAVPYGINYAGVLLTGIWCLVTLRRKEVIAGFNYTAD
jgi:hypothetical protein